MSIPPRGIPLPAPTAGRTEVLCGELGASFELSAEPPCRLEPEWARHTVLSDIPPPPFPRIG
jgi:hypothetical protein